MVGRREARRVIRDAGARSGHGRARWGYEARRDWSVRGWKQRLDVGT